MKALFLDIDGVLNDHVPTASGYCGIVPRMAGQLNRILAETGCKLVISSAWRYLIHSGSMTLKGFEHLLETHGVKAHNRVYGLTAEDHWIWDRGDQIRHWLRQHPEVTRAVIIDDGGDERWGPADMGLPRAGVPWVQIDSCVGMRAKEADEVIRLLNGEERPAAPPPYAPPAVGSLVGVNGKTYRVVAHPRDADELTRVFLTNPDGRWLNRSGIGYHTDWDTVFVVPEAIAQPPAGHGAGGRSETT